MKKQLFFMAMLMAMSLSASAQQLLPYQNPNLSAEARANDLLSRLTLEEKTKLMMDTSPAIARLGIPQFQWWNEALHGVGRNGFVTVFRVTCKSVWLRINSCESKQEELSIYNTSQLCSKLLDFSI